MSADALRAGGDRRRPPRAGITPESLSTLEGVRLDGGRRYRSRSAPRRLPQRAAPSALTDFRELLDRVDAVVVAVPTEAHLDVALPFLERGVAVLVEKPMAQSLAEADAMIAAAAASGATLAVGQTERYNPAVAAVLPLVTSPRFIEVHRLGAFSERSLDIDVVFDVMIHDLDIILALVRSEIVSIEAVGVPVLTPEVRHRQRPAALCVRVHRERHRQPHQPRPRPQDPLLPARRLHLHRLRRAGGRRVAARRGATASARRFRAARSRCKRDEPLRRELADFVPAIRDRRSPLVDGAAGRRALALATEVAREDAESVRFMSMRIPGSIMVR